MIGAAAALAAAAAAGLQCEPAGAGALRLSWAAESNTDLYWVALLEGSGGRPFAIETVTPPQGAAVVNHTLRGLAPARRYWLQLRSHPASAPSTVWGWRAAAGAAAQCETLGEPAAAAPPPAPAPGVRHTRMWRVSENTYEIDLLSNHNAADYAAQVAFLTGANDNLFFELSRAPVTEYCVEHLDLDWAQYTSCNAPEAGTRNHHSDPICICFVYADRMIAQRPLSEMQRDCLAPAPGPNGTYSDPPCLCTGPDGKRSKYEVPAAAQTAVGRSTVMAPYFYWQIPRETYPGAAVIGYDYALPKGGECPEGVPLGTAGCTWRRRPRARVLWGDRLLRLGWNATSAPFWPLHASGPNVTGQLAHNAAVFGAAWEQVAALMERPPCG
eukprot:TRINITY_DN2290_c7_g1_i1.p2 TRINITY_DN2290_c7_g1~~TRINITY_DN2290_c7_g1_i1.p2  ORF type:complete len:384 (+),score=112.51 TRINITY_DN2290_c7_g1_i1:74-1225(+)